MPKRTAEDVCIEYAIAAGVVRSITDKIKPWECTKYVQGGVNLDWKPGRTEPVDPCLQQLFAKRDPDERQDVYDEAQQEIEDEMCDRCRESLQAVRDRKVARKRLGAAKRAVDAVGKRLGAAVTA